MENDFESQIASALGSPTAPSGNEQSHPEPKPSSFDDELAGALGGQPDPQAHEIHKALQPDPGVFSSWAHGIGETWGDSSKGFLGKVMTTATEGEQLAVRGLTSFLGSVGAMPVEDSKKLLQNEELHGHDIVNYYWKNGDGSPEEGLVKFGMGFGLDILLDPLTYLGVGVASRAAKTLEVAGQTISNVDKLSGAEQAMLRASQKIEKVLKSDGALTSVEGLTKDEALKQNLSLIGEYANKQIGAEDLFGGLKNLSPGVLEETKAAHQQAITKGLGYFDKWATGEKALTAGVQVPFTNFAYEMDVPLASYLTRPSGEAMAKMLDAVGRSGLVNNKAVRFVNNAANSVWTKTGYPLMDAMKNRWFGLKNASEDIAQGFAKEWYPKLKDQDMEQLSFLMEHYVDNPEEKATFWSAKSGQEHYEKNLQKLNTEFGHPTEKVPLHAEGGPVTLLEGADDYAAKHEDILQKSLDHQDQEKSRLLKKFTFDPAVVKERFPNFTGINDTEREFIAKYREHMDARVKEMASRPGLHFQPLDPREEGSANEYLTHRIADEFWENKKDTAQAVEYMFDHLEQSGLLVDRNNLGREYRGYIYDANKKMMSKSGKTAVGPAAGEEGFKKFMDDPIYLATERMKAMDRDIRNYDLMDVAGQHALVLEKGQEAPQGYIIASKKHFGSVDEAKIGEVSKFPDDEVRRSSDGYLWRRYVPPTWVQNEGRLAVPERVYNNLIDTVNPRQYSNFTNAILDMNDKFMKVFRNTALFGPGYLGMKMSSDMLNYLVAGHTSTPIMAMADAVRAVHGSEEAVFHFADHMGRPYELSKQELYQTMLEHNVLRSNITSTADFADVAENIASTQQARQSFGKKFTKALDMGNLWYANRQLTKFAEDIPKAALFIDRLRGGFSPEAAAEAAERVFGSFNNQNVGARALGGIFPFTSVGLKTLEGTAARLARGEFAQLSIPGKVEAALQGAFVPDKDLRQALNENLPLYYQHGVDRIHGPLLPGQREILIEAPWVLNTMHFFIDPKANVHPLLKMLGAWASSKEEREWNDITPLEEKEKAFGETIGKFIPSWLKNSLAIAELRGVFNMGGAFKNDLMHNVGASALGLDRLDVKVPYSDKTEALAQSFGDSVQFGKYLEENRKDNFLYDLIFPKIDASNPYGKDAYALAQRGQFIKQHFRDITLGYAVMTDMDKNVAINLGAMRRQEQKLLADYKEDIARQGMLPNASMTPEQMQEASMNSPKLKKALEIKSHIEALHDYYNWYVGVEKKYSGINPWKLMFGEYKFDVKSKPLPPIKEMMASPARSQEGENE